MYLERAFVEPIEVLLGEREVKRQDAGLADTQVAEVGSGEHGCRKAKRKIRHSNGLEAPPNWCFTLKNDEPFTCQKSKNLLFLSPPTSQVNNVGQGTTCADRPGCR